MLDGTSTERRSRTRVEQRSHQRAAVLQHIGVQGVLSGWCDDDLDIAISKGGEAVLCHCDGECEVCEVCVMEEWWGEEEAEAVFVKEKEEKRR